MSAAPAYVPIATGDEFSNEHTTYEMTATVVEDLGKPTVVSQFSHLPEAKNLTWTDNFFDDDNDDDGGDIVAVFDFDYDAMESFYTSLGCVALGCTLLYAPIFVVSLVGLVPCFLRKNVEWNARSQHIAVTRDGIRFVQDRRPTCWGMACTDKGKSSKTVPFDKITDCDITEPAGNECLCVTRILSTVNVDTASSGGGMEGNHELKIVGLKNPHGFKKLVWAMKRALGPTTANGGVGSMFMSDRGASVESLLKEIRDELRQNNALLRGGGGDGMLCGVQTSHKSAAKRQVETDLLSGSD